MGWVENLRTVRQEGWGVEQQARGFLLLTGVWLTLGRLWELGDWGHSQARHLNPH